MKKQFLYACMSIYLFGMTSGGLAQASRPQEATSPQRSFDALPQSLHVAGTTIPDSSLSVPRLIKFSGILKDGKGDAKTGVAGVTFAIYAEQEGGAPLWMETQNVALDEAGRYAALLGTNSSEGVRLELFSTGQARWLGVEAQDIEEVPRVLLVSVPYALKAADAETLAGLPVSAFALASPQTGSTSGASQSAAGTGPTSPATATSLSSKSKAAATTSTVSAASSNFLAKFDATSNLITSNVFELNGHVGIGTTGPSVPLQVNGNILLTGQINHQVQVSGTASSGRFGQDSNGTFLASDTGGSSLRFLTSNSSLNEWMRIGSSGSVNIGSAQHAQHGEVVFAPDNLDTVHSVTGQSGSQYHFRLSRATPDIPGFKDLLITPYNYGMAIEYPSTIEVFSGNFSVHMHPSCAPLAYCGPGANLWVGDEIDSGGLYVTALDNGGGTNSRVTLAADRFNHASHGSLNFVVRNTTDAFKFDVGALGSEVVKAQISGPASASSLDLFSGSVQATVRAQSGSPGAVQF